LQSFLNNPSGISASKCWPPVHEEIRHLPDKERRGGSRRHQQLNKNMWDDMDFCRYNNSRLMNQENTMPNPIDRITINPDQCGGRPCIRGMRIRVIDVLDLFAAGLSAEEILEELPDLENEDIKAALNYAARRLGHPVMVA